MLRLRKKLSIINAVVLSITLLGSANYMNVKATESKPRHKDFINSIRNVSVNQTSGTLLNINTKTIEEKGKNYKLTENGQAIDAKIKIKDSQLTGSLNSLNIEYLLDGYLDEEAGKYIGSVTNINGYTFEAYVTDVSKGYVLINIFDQNKSPQTFVISDKKATTEKVKISQSSSEPAPQLSSLSFAKPTLATAAVTDYYEHLVGLNARGMNFQVQGPGTGVTVGTWDHKVNVRTIVGDAWADSSINNYIHYASFVIKNIITAEPSDTGTSITPLDPVTNGTTSISIPFYFGSTIGVQVIPVTTSSTTVARSAYGLTDTFTWTPAIAYLDEASSTYTAGKKSFGAEYNWSTNNTGMRRTNVTVTLQYELIAKQNEFTSNVYAYPSYTSTTAYYVSVN